MSIRTFYLLGLIAALIAAAPIAAHAADGRTVQWSPPSTSASGSADEAAQLARQAAELAQRAAQMAAAAKNSTGASTSAPAPIVNASIPTTVQQPSAMDIRFENSTPTAVVSDSTPSNTLAHLPVISRPAATAANPAFAPTAASATALHDDSQVRLATTSYLDSRMASMVQEEPLPAAPGSHQPQPMAQNTNVYDSTGYGNCGPECCPPQRVLFWTGGVEATFLSPDLNNHGVAFSVEEIDDDRYDYVDTQNADVDSLYFSPRAWVGIQGACWGANLRYWHLQAGEGQYDPSLGGIGTWDDYDCGRADLGYFSCSRLEAYTVDLEITRRFCISDCAMQASFGVRHADLENNDSITGLAITDEGLLAGYARSNRYSRGTGILLGLYGRKPVFPCSCVNWFYNVRWSALWGPTYTSTESFASVQSNDPNFVATAASVNGAYTNVDSSMFIGEIQLGLEWNYALQCIPANTFCRFAVEYQRWDGGSVSSAADSFAGISVSQQSNPTSIVRTAGWADAPQMDLFGFTFATGVTW